MLLHHEDDLEGLFFLRLQACASLIHCGTEEFKSYFKEPKGQLFDARKVTAKMNILDEDIPFLEVPPAVFDLFQPLVADVSCSQGDQNGWEYLPWFPHSVLPLVLIYMSVLRDLRNMSSVLFLKQIRRLPNEIVDHIRYWSPETDSILG